MHKLKEHLLNELYDYENEVKKSPSGKPTVPELDRIHKLTDTIKNIDKIEMLESGDYSEASDWIADSRGKGSSYGRRRDGMGRYSKGRDGMADRLYGMLDDAETPREREAIKRCLSELEK